MVGGNSQRSVKIGVRPTVAAQQEPRPSHPLSATVVIVSYNARDKLLCCLASVLGSTQAESEVIVVDNDSSDGSAEAVAVNFPDVTLIRSKTNVGFGKGSNLGARQGRGKYLVFLNPDTLVEPAWMEGLLAPFESDARIGLVTGKILLADRPNEINTCGNIVHLTGLTLCRGWGQPRETMNEPEEVDAVSGAAFAIRRELFEMLGGFDEDAFLYMEDTDLSWRARLAGWRCLYVPDSVVLHDYTLRITPLKVFYQERNRYLMLLKNLKWPTLIVLLPAELLAEVVTWSFVLLRDRRNLRNKVQAYRWIILNWPAIMRKRTATQALRRISDRELLKHTSFRLDFDQVATGVISRVARMVFDPLFFVLKAVTLALVWW